MLCWRGAAQEKVCQTDKCSTHDDDNNMNSYGQTVGKTISRKPTSSIFISIKWHQIINLLSLPPLTAHMQMAVLQGACTCFMIFIDGIKRGVFFSCCSPFISARQSSKAGKKTRSTDFIVLERDKLISVEHNRIWQADFLLTSATAKWL